MNKKQEANSLVKECITTALLQMMETTPYEQIAITDLVKKAGVGRVSFYRNFESKKDVIEKQLVFLLKEWGREFEARGDLSAFSDSVIRHYYKHKDFYLLLYKQGLSDMIYETLRYACRLDEARSNFERYNKSMFAGMLFGWVDEWMRKGMPESPDEIALLSAQMNTTTNGHLIKLCFGRA